MHLVIFTNLVNLDGGCQMLDLPTTTTPGALEAQKRQVQVLRRLAEGGTCERSGDRYIMAGEDVSHEVAVLVALGLAQRDRQGAARISPPGRAYLRRQAAGRALAAARRRRDTAAATVLSPYRSQHQELETIPAPDAQKPGARAFLDRRCCPLSWLARRKDPSGKPLITRRQYEAGVRLRNDFELGGLSPKVSASWSGLPIGAAPGPVGGAALNPTERQAAAQQRFRRATSALGPGLADVAIRVCCGFEGLEAVERALSWPARSGKVVLGLALDRLAAHYGIG